MCGKEHIGGEIVNSVLAQHQKEMYESIRQELIGRQERFAAQLRAGKVFVGQVF